MKTIVFDTNVLIRFLEKGGDFARGLERYERVLIPAPVDGEYRAGLDLATKAGRRRVQALEAFLSDESVEFVAIDRVISEKYALLFQTLKKQGTPIPQNDIWIAAVALVRNAALATFDEHFANIQLLPLERMSTPD